MSKSIIRRGLAGTTGLLLICLTLTAAPSNAITNPVADCSQNGGLTCTVTFASNAEAYAWTVPNNAGTLHFHLVGGVGGNATSDAETAGGLSKSALVVDLDLAVPSGTVLNIGVGSGGSNASGGVGGLGGTNPLGTYGGGKGANAGPAGTSGAGGGGGAASAVTFGSQAIIAGGSGGAGGGSWNIVGLDGLTAHSAGTTATVGGAGLVAAADGGGGGGGGGGLVGGAGGVAGCDRPPTATGIACQVAGISAGGGYAGSNSANSGAIKTTTVRTAGASGFVTISFATSRFPGTPTIASLLTGNTNVTLNVTAPYTTGTSPILRYEYSLNSGTTWSTLLSTSVAGQYRISSLKNSIPYNVSVRAVNSAGPGTATANTSFTPTYKVPSAPKISSFVLSSQQVIIHIDPPANFTAQSVTGYQYSTDNGAVWTTANVVSGTVLISGLTNGVTHYVRVRAVGTNGPGSQSPKISANPFTNPTAPVIGNIVTASGKLTIPFTAPASDGGRKIRTYEYSLDGGVTWTSRVPARYTSPLTLTGLTNGRTYDVCLRAVTLNTTGSKSNVVPAALTYGLTASSAQVGTMTDGPTQFIKFVKITGVRPSVMSNVSFAITPKAGSVTVPISATYSKAYLARNNYLDSTNSSITVPVFGLYANYANTVVLKYYEGSSVAKQLSTTVTTPVWVDPFGSASRFTSPTKIVPRNNNVALDFSFYMMKASATGSHPVVIDTDGEIRWVGIKNEASQSAILYDNGMYVGTGSHLTRTELDGRFAQVADYSASHGVTNTGHHNYDIGKNGFLVEVDTTYGIESVILEVDAAGKVLETFDFADIIEDDMIEYGDDPSGFVNRSVDWFHNNAATYWEQEDTLVVSSREDFVIGVDYTTKKIKWILGDDTKLWHQYPSLRRYELTLPAGSLAPIGQHAVSITSQGELMLFDNGKESLVQVPIGETRFYSAPRKYRIDLTNMTATETWNYQHSPAIWSPICSSIYQDGSGYLINYASENLWGTGPLYVRMMAINEAGQIAFEYRYQGNWGTGWNTSPIHLENIVYK